MLAYKEFWNYAKKKGLQLRDTNYILVKMAGQELVAAIYKYETEVVTFRHAFP